MKSLEQADFIEELEKIERNSERFNDFFLEVVEIVEVEKQSDSLHFQFQCSLFSFTKLIIFLFLFLF